MWLTPAAMAVSRRAAALSAASPRRRRRRRSRGRCRGPCGRTALARSQRQARPGVGVGELGAHYVEIVGPLLEGTGAPLAAGRVDEVAAVDVDGAGDAVEGIGDPVD